MRDQVFSEAGQEAEDSLLAAAVTGAGQAGPVRAASQASPGSGPPAPPAPPAEDLDGEWILGLGLPLRSLPAGLLLLCLICTGILLPLSALHYSQGMAGQRQAATESLAKALAGETELLLERGYGLDGLAGLDDLWTRRLDQLRGGKPGYVLMTSGEGVILDRAGDFPVNRDAALADYVASWQVWREKQARPGAAARSQPPVFPGDFLHDIRPLLRDGQVIALLHAGLARPSVAEILLDGPVLLHGLLPVLLLCCALLLLPLFPVLQSRLIRPFGQLRLVLERGEKRQWLVGSQAKRQPPADASPGDAPVPDGTDSPAACLAAELEGRIDDLEQKTAACREALGPLASDADCGSRASRLLAVLDLLAGVYRRRPDAMLPEPPDRSGKGLFLAGLGEGVALLALLGWFLPGGVPAEHGWSGFLLPVALAGYGGLRLACPARAGVPAGIVRLLHHIGLPARPFLLLFALLPLLIGLVDSVWPAAGLLAGGQFPLLMILAFLLLALSLSAGPALAQPLLPRNQPLQPLSLPSLATSPAAALLSGLFSGILLPSCLTGAFVLMLDPADEALVARLLFLVPAVLAAVLVPLLLMRQKRSEEAGLEAVPPVSGLVPVSGWRVGLVPALLLIGPVPVLANLLSTALPGTGGADLLPGLLPLFALAVLAWGSAFLLAGRWLADWQVGLSGEEMLFLPPALLLLVAMLPVAGGFTGVPALSLLTGFLALFLAGLAAGLFLMLCGQENGPGARRGGWPVRLPLLLLVLLAPALFKLPDLVLQGLLFLVPLLLLVALSWRDKQPAGVVRGKDLPHEAP